LKPAALFALLAAIALAQTASGPAGLPLGPGAADQMAKDAAAKEQPVIPIELQAEYFRTDGVLAHLRAELAAANAEYEAAVKAMIDACGKGAAPTLTQDKKHLFCVAQPPAPVKK
jgi:hypothetical protein